jgi:hypothetical protein
MKIIILIIISVLLYYIFKNNNSFKEHLNTAYSGSVGGSTVGTSYIGGSRVNLLGPSINGYTYQDNMFLNNHVQNIDPYSIELDNNNNIVLTPYENNLINTFKDSNTKESLIFAILKEILSNVKNILNSKNKTTYGYELNSAIHINAFSSNNHYNIVDTNVFDPVITTIFNSINAISKNITVTPNEVDKYIVIQNKKNNLYIVDTLFKINVKHSSDLIHTNNVSKKDSIPLKIIIKFTIDSLNNIFYINDLSVISPK